MSYNKEAFPHYMKTAGKISVLAAVAGLAVFLFAFMVDVGQQEFQRVSAQTATTSLTVLNTPPTFDTLPTEVIPSSTTSPTNSGDVIQWTAVGNDSNGAPYFLLVCSTNATPTANEAANPSSLGTAPPECGVGAIQWAVSASTTNLQAAFAATTTVDAATASLFAESNEWYAWVCDDDPVQAECNPTPSQGLFGPGASSSSPFNVNSRPVLTNAYNDGPVDPGALLTFLSTSSDPDTVGGTDTMTIVVCGAAIDYNPVTNDCDANFIASTSVPANPNVTATTTIAIPVRDRVYDAFVFLLDEHGHEAAANPIQANFEVANVAPTLQGSDIFLADTDGVGDLTLTSPGGTTTGFRLDFTVSDANSCENASAGDEIVGFEVSVLRSGPSGAYSTSTNCNPQNADYNPNGCYTNGVPFDVWQLSCTASSTSCTGPTDETQVFNCTFPLWFLADPTDAGPNTPASFAGDAWIAAVAGADDNFATSSQVATDFPVDLTSAPYIDLLTAVIPYGALAPGDNTGTLSTSTTIINIGNTGIDQLLDGSAMCPGFVSSSSDCSLNGTSTIFTSNQKFATTAVSYISPFAQTLPTTTVALPAELELNVIKSTSTTTPETDETFWGIAVPSAINVAGAYTGLNTFFGVTAEAVDWQ